MLPPPLRPRRRWPQSRRIRSCWLVNSMLCRPGHLTPLVLHNRAFAYHFHKNVGYQHSHPFSTCKIRSLSITWWFCVFLDFPSSTEDVKYRSPQISNISYSYMVFPKMAQIVFPSYEVQACRSHFIQKVNNSSDKRQQ